MRIFTKVVEAGSFTKAAKQLSIPKSTVSRRVANLEDHLQVRLLQRTTRKLTLTAAGQLYFARTARVIEELHQAEIALEELQKDPRGLLRITIPSDLGGIFVRLISEFQERYPLVEVAAFSTGRRVDLVAEGYDVALRGGVLSDSSLVSKKIIDTRLGIFASTKYLNKKGRPTTLAELKNHTCLTWGTEKTEAVWTLTGPKGEESVTVSGPLGSNDFGLLVGGCEVGMGLALLPSFEASELVSIGRLERVLPEFIGAFGGLYAVYPSARHLSPKVRAFIDFSAQWFNDCSNLVRGEGEGARAGSGGKGACTRSKG